MRCIFALAQTYAGIVCFPSCIRCGSQLVYGLPLNLAHRTQGSLIPQSPSALKKTGKAELLSRRLLRRYKSGQDQ